MQVKKGDREMEILKAVAHPVRKGILSSLSYGQQAFSNLMLDCGLDPGSETGLFLYHLSKLMEKGFVKKSNGRYRLTKHGEAASRLLQSLPRLDIYPQNDKGGEKIVRSEISIPKINVKEVVGGDMVIDKWEFKPGEKRVYEESGRIPSDIFGGTFYIEECLGTVDLPNEQGRVFMIRHESYTRNYFGTDKNRIRTPVKDGYHLAMRGYDNYSVRDDGVYILWISVWGSNYENEKPDETFYEPLRKVIVLPMKIGDEKKEEEMEGKYFHSWHWKVIGQYEVSIGEKKYDCLLKRAHNVWTENGVVISRVSERFTTNGFIDVLTRTYHAATQKRKWMYESVKGWEKNPKVECCGEKHYLTNEFFLTKRTY